MAGRHLDNWLDSYMLYTYNSEPPILYHKWTGVSIIAACLQRKCVLRWGPIDVYPNMYIVLVGPPGRCRKTTAMKMGLDFLTELGVRVAPESATREALIQELAQCSTSDIMSMGATAIPKMHASLTVFSTELTVFLGWNNPQLLTDLTNWYDCDDRWRYTTKTQGKDDIAGVWVNLIGATTPDLIQSALPMDTVGSGLASRIIFIYEDKKGKLIPVPHLEESELELRKTLALDLDQIRMSSGEYKLTTDFWDAWIPWYTGEAQKASTDDERFAGYFERRPMHILRLCMILNASRTNDMIISAEDFQASLNLLKATEVKMPMTFGGMGRSDISSVMHRVMTFIAVKGTVTKSQLLGVFHRDADTFTMERILKTLHDMGWAKVLYDKGDETITRIKKEGEKNEPNSGT